jgi:Phosphoserine phosphatase RsbU, N-terminal domain
VVTELERVRRNYRVAFLRYLSQQDEAALNAAYQIGRTAVTEGLSLLKLAEIHHQVLFEVLKDSPSEDLDDLASTAADFLVELLASYEMARPHSAGRGS